MKKALIPMGTLTAFIFITASTTNKQEVSAKLKQSNVVKPFPKAEEAIAGIFKLATPVGGLAFGPAYAGEFEDLSKQGPLGVYFRPEEEPNMGVGQAIDKVRQEERCPSRGEARFIWIEEENLVAGEQNRLHSKGLTWQRAVVVR